MKKKSQPKAFKPLLGSHMSLSKSGGYLEGVAYETIAQGANTFMIFTGPPQNTKRVPLELLKIDEMKALLKDYQISEKNLVVHAPYLINIANSVNESL